MTNLENWLDKYKPTKLSEVLGDQTQIKIIDNFVKQFTKKNMDKNKIPNPNLIITGTNGVGKTLITDLVIRENGLEKITADLSNISVARKTKRKKKVEKETIGTNRTVKTYYMSLKSNKKLLPNGEYSNKKIALVFDDVSNISNPKEKEAIKAIIKHNNKYKEFPIFIIANTKHSKTVNELKKMVTYIIKRTHADGKKENRKIINEVVIRAPQYSDLEDFVKKICAKEKLRIVQRKSDDDDIYVQLIKHAQYDVRRLINILEELKLIYQDNEVTLEKFEQYCETSKTKDLDPGIYEATRMLLNKYTNMDSALLLYGEERATIPLMVHENYPLNIRQQYPKMSVDDQINMIYDISKSMSESDKVDGLIYSNQCWSLQPVHGFYSCVMPSYYINKTPGKLSRIEKYKYTQDYNKTSIKKINNKVIKKAQEHQYLKKVSIYDFLYIASILKTLLDKKDFEKVAELMKPYDLKLKEIESIIKIDKIKKPKNMLTGKQRNILKELLGVDE
ncbi:mg482 protein [Tupanvirus deep ocean]|uniref:Mg482 protein n=2 Tax=Tupanvirus TaxID=2094720 RepID=A0AC62A8N4_9VIRU|nr:mg482 protein [Tupanvirus deep ocean]QKU34020.1 mg482 protein [Tupanvirus deep ocean]